jgi:hypothetical protein
MEGGGTEGVMHRYSWLIEWERTSRTVWSNDPQRPVGHIETRREQIHHRRQYRTTNDAVQARRALQRRFPSDAKWTMRVVGAVAKLATQAV